MKKLLKFSSAAALAGTVLFSCKQEAKILEKEVAAEIPADVQAAADKWNNLEQNADPLFMKSLEHTDLGSEQFSFSKGNVFQELYKGYKEFLNNESIKSEILKEPNAQKYIELADQVMLDSGLMSWESSAFSSRPENDSQYITKSYVICQPDYTDKLLFSLLGGAEQELTIMDKMPADTALALSGTLDTSKLVKYLDKLAAQYPELMKDYSMGRSQAGMVGGMMGVDIEALISELNQPMSLIVTLDPKEMIKLPNNIEINKPGIIVSLGKPGDQMNKLTELMQKQGQFTMTAEGENKFFTMPQAIPFLNTKGVITVTADDFVFASNQELLQAYLSTSKANAPSTKETSSFSYGNDNTSTSTQASITSNPEFKELTKGFSKKGNGFVYLPKSTAKLVMDSFFTQIKNKPNFSDDDQKALDVMESYKKEFYLAGIYSLTPQGITSQMRSSFGMSGGPGTLASVSTIGILSAMILPALGTARAKAHAKKATNSLKQAGLGMMMYYSDGSETKIPKDYHKAFEWELRLFSHSNRNFTATSWDQVFSSSSPWKFFLKPGTSFADIESSDYPVMAVPAMKSGDKLLVLYGDGHVSTTTVYNWEDMSTEELFQSLKN